MIEANVLITGCRVWYNDKPGILLSQKGRISKVDTPFGIINVRTSKLSNDSEHDRELNIVNNHVPPFTRTTQKPGTRVIKNLFYTSLPPDYEAIMPGVIALM